MVTRLEQLGFDTLSTLAEADAYQIVSGAAPLLGSSCWKNSAQAKAAIQAAIQAASHHKARLHQQNKLPQPGAILLECGVLPNLGPKSLGFMAAAGIVSVEQLRELVSIATYARVKQLNASATLNLLWVLEGALTNTPWQEVSRQHRTSLLLALDAYKNGSFPL